MWLNMIESTCRRWWRVHQLQARSRPEAGRTRSAGEQTDTSISWGDHQALGRGHWSRTEILAHYYLVKRGDGHVDSAEGGAFGRAGPKHQTVGHYAGQWKGTGIRLPEGQTIFDDPIGQIGGRSRAGQSQGESQRTRRTLWTTCRTTIQASGQANAKAGHPQQA